MHKTKKARRADMLLAELSELNFDPARELIKIAKTPAVKPDTKMKICLAFMPYVYPTMKAVEIDTSGGQPVVFNFDVGSPVLSQMAGVA